VYLRAGKHGCRIAKMTKAEFAHADALQRHEVVFVANLNGRNYWQYQDRFHWDDEGLITSQVHALLHTRQQRRGAEIQRAEQIVAMGSMPRQTQRGAISDEVKHFVWTRDGGPAVTVEAPATCSTTTSSP
jgi:hypothetical protein